MGMRILVTGSRNWRNHCVVRLQLARCLAEIPVGGKPVLINGGQASFDPVTKKNYGADWIAVDEWYRLAKLCDLDIGVETYMADWKQLGKKAGPVRNQQMVDAGADICLTFAMTGSRGTLDCAKRARAAGIPTFDYGVSTEVTA